MFTTTIQPRFGDTDILGHINNAVLAGWFEAARNPFFRFFVPDLKIDLETFSLIIAHTDYDYVDELFFHYEVTVHSWVSRVGDRSFTIYHEAWQNGRLCVKGSAVLVNYDFKNKQSIPLSDEKKKLLGAHLRAD